MTDDLMQLAMVLKQRLGPLTHVSASLIATNKQ